MSEEKQNKINEIQINGQSYVLKPENVPAKEVDGLKYCVIRTYSAGVHIGYVKEFSEQQVTLINARRLHYWENAASLSQVAVDGCAGKDKGTRFSVIVPEILLTDFIEMIPCTEKAKTVLEGIEEWKK